MTSMENSKSKTREERATKIHDKTIQLDAKKPK